jgi:hypothetical protein
MENKKLYISPLRMIITFTVIWLLIELLIIGGGYLINYQYMNENYTTVIIIAVAIFVGCAVLLVLGLKTSYYELTKKGIMYYRPGKNLYYDFKMILYIDEKYSEKHHVMLCYTDQGRDLYLVFDQKGKIYEYALKYCPNLITREEYIMRFPNIKM